jgi:2,3-bisphosphoglycerate-dependent phosphoglycerate mutase
MPTLVLVRNGETVLTAENKFCSWSDSDLSELGKIESLMAGKKLKNAGLYFDIAFTSLLRQDIKTLWLLQEGMEYLSIDTFHDWRLNSRHLGAMEGLNIDNLSKEFGSDNLKLWLNRFDSKPPQLDLNDPEFINILNDMRYIHLLPSEIPTGECLLDAAKRSLSCWKDRMGVSQKQNANLLCVAGESTLKSLIMFLDKLSPDEFSDISVDSKSPIVYELDGELRVMRKSFL